MGILGAQNANLITGFAQNILHLFKRKKTYGTSLCNGRIIKMHYIVSFAIFMLGYAAVTYSWYYSNTITCVSKFNADVQVRMDHINICLSYPFVRKGEDEREYLLYYRWIHLTLLVIALLNYIPRKLSKYSENPKARYLTEEMACHISKYDHSEKELINRATSYISNNMSTHNGLFFKYFIVNLSCLIIDIISFRGLDHLFNGKFFHYGFSAMSTYRDPWGFTDYISRTFPPFVSCEITPTHQLLNKRTELYGCQLPIMELYEKYFFVVWFWLLFSMICTTIYLLFLGCFFLPYFRQIILMIPNPMHAEISVRDSIANLLNIRFCKIGDVYLLYRLKQYTSPTMYYDLITNLCKSEFLAIAETHPKDRAAKKRERTKHYDTMREMSSSDDSFIQQKNRKPNTSIYIG